MNINRPVINHAFFFVVGFSLAFALLGVLLQTLLSKISYDATQTLSFVGGILIILFGIFSLGFIHISWLEKDLRALSFTRKLVDKAKAYPSLRYIMSALFGVAFAFGWSPCVGPLLGAILTLAAAKPSLAFLLLISYAIGMSIPILLIALFFPYLSNMMRKVQKTAIAIRWIFGMLLILLGVIIVTNTIFLLSDFTVAQELLAFMGPQTLSATFIVNIGFAFLAGVLSALSPCVLPLLPGFFAYLAATNE